jgi:hypothetical protein
MDEAVANLKAYIPSSKAISAFYAIKDTDENKCVDLIPRQTDYPEVFDGVPLVPTTAWTTSTFNSAGM